ncbi:MAG: hypothetical protein ACU83N_00840 [Gammaproteobacteria bacterium]
MTRNEKKVLPAFVIPVLALILIGFQPVTVSANVLTSVDASDLIESNRLTGPEQYQELIQLRNEIATSTTIEKARTMALAPTEGAIDALKNARAVLPFSDDLLNAEVRLSDARSRILVASSQEQVANEFSGMMLAGLDDDRVAHVNVGKVGCNYSTGEIIAIVVGLILGIIPGLILLIVLC